MNRIERWFKRHDLSDTQRKMKEWNTNSYRVFFAHIFNSQITEEELNYILQFESRIEARINFERMFEKKYS